jgi:hypothetical protein
MCLLKNHTARTSLNNRTPLEKRTGHTPDISKFLSFRWWEPVYFLNKDGIECLGRWAGVAEHVGDELTYIVISEKTGQAIFRSDIRTATDPNAPNFRAEVIAGINLQPSAPKDEGSQPVFPLFGSDESAPVDEKVHPFMPEELIGKTVMREDAEGNIVRSEIVLVLLKQDKDNTRKRVKFLIETKNGNESAEEIMEYNELCDLVEKQLHAIENDNLGGVRMFDRILAHQGPLTVKDPRYKGLSYNLLIEWDGMEPTWEPLNIIAADDKVSCAIYGEANGLLDTKVWKNLKKEALNIRKVYKRVQEVLKAKHEAKYKYGIRIPDRTKSFAECDAENGNTAWADANQLEIDLLEAFKAFEDHGEFTQEKADVLIAKGYQYIRMQMIYDAKHDGRQRARFVAGGHMTKVYGSKSYSPVVSLRTLRLAMLLGELNRLKIKVGDITSSESWATNGGSQGLVRPPNKWQILARSPLRHVDGDGLQAFQSRPGHLDARQWGGLRVCILLH